MFEDSRPLIILLTLPQFEFVWCFSMIVFSYTFLIKRAQNSGGVAFPPFGNSPGACRTVLIWISLAIASCLLCWISKYQRGPGCSLCSPPSSIHILSCLFYRNLMETGTLSTMLSLRSFDTQPPTHLFLWVSKKYLTLWHGWKQTTDPFSPKCPPRGSELRPK